MSNFSFPIIRYGRIWKTAETLDYKAAEKVAASVEKYTETKKFISIFCELFKNDKSYVLAEQPEIVKGPQTDTWEGWVAYSPVIRCLIKKGQILYEVSVRFSIVACTQPNHSKVWANTLLLAKFNKGAKSKIEANALGKDEVERFFDEFIGLAKEIASLGERIYKAKLNKVLKKEIGIELVKSLVIKAVGSKDTYYSKLAKEIRAGRIIKLSEEVSSVLQKEQGLKDLLYLVFQKDVEDAQEYSRLLAEKEKRQLKGERKTSKKKNKPQIEPFNQIGLQWFGLKYDGAVAIYSREKLFEGTQEIVSYCGVSPAHDDISSYPQLNVAALDSSSALVSLVSPFL